MAFNLHQYIQASPSRMYFYMFTNLSAPKCICSLRNMSRVEPEREEKTEQKGSVSLALSLSLFSGCSGQKGMCVEC